MPHPYPVSFLFIPSLYPSLFNSKNFLFSSVYRDGRGSPASCPYIIKIPFKLSLLMLIQFYHQRMVTMGNMHVYLKYGKNCITIKRDITKSLFSQFLLLLFSFKPCNSKTVNSTDLELCTQVGFHDGSCSHM